MMPEDKTVTGMAPAIHAAIIRIDPVRRGMMLMALSVLLFTLMDAVSKDLMSSLPLAQVILLRGAGGLVPLILWTACQPGRFTLWRTQQPILNMVSGLAVMGSLVFLFYSFQRLPLTLAYMMLYTMPIWASLMAVPILREKLHPRMLLAILAGFAGVVVMLNPLGSELDKTQLTGIGAALLGAQLYALWLVLVRRLNRTDHELSVAFGNTMMMIILALPFGLAVWQPPADGFMLGKMVMSGVIGGVAQILMTTAFRLGPARAIAPFEYSSMLWVVLIDWLVWQTVPGLSVFIGAVLVIGCGVWIARNADH